MHKIVEAFNFTILTHCQIKAVLKKIPRINFHLEKPQKKIFYTQKFPYLWYMYALSFPGNGECTSGALFPTVPSSLAQLAGDLVTMG